MKNKKEILFVLTVSCLVLLSTSCHDILNEDSRSEVLDTHLNTRAGFEQAVNACYSHTRWWWGATQAGSMMSVAGTDTWLNGFGGTLIWATYNDNLNGSHEHVHKAWTVLYRGVNSCNAIITRAPELTDIGEGLKNIRVAEARFLRAIYYFQLVQQWGPVHITLEETRGIETEAIRSPVADVYTTIIDDLEFAVQTLPIEASDYGRATKPAAENLLSLVYLTRASHPDAMEPTDYENAADLAKGVIDNYNFQLLDDFANLWGPENDINSEVIWSVQNSDNELTSGPDDCCGDPLDAGGMLLWSNFMPRYQVYPGMERDMYNGRASSRHKPTQFVLEELFDDEIDGRFDKSFQRVWYTNVPGTYTSFNGYEITLAEGDTAIYVPKIIWSEERISEAGYSVFNPDNLQPRMYPMLTKFIDRERFSINDKRSRADFLFMRLAETHLIAAEALMMMGNLDEAAMHVNVVRNRAAKQGATEAETESNRLAMQITPDQLDIDFILDERARELLGELKRWNDLVRTGKLIERVMMYNEQAAPNIQPYHVLRPIPQDVIDRVSTEFSQNPGYPGAD
jgi:starch-binding outer membrane protein, SusD/RagB family